MNGQAETQTEDAAALQGLLGAAGRVPTGLNTREVNPMESIPTAAVGKEILPGSVICGTYVRTETIASPKFTYAKTTNAAGVPTQERHILRLQNGSLLGVWSTGELKAVFDKWPVGSMIILKYIKKGLNADNNQQHFFEYREVLPKEATH